MAERHELKRRRIMRDFVIKELSAVDRPAQAHALAVVIKHTHDEGRDMQLAKITRDKPLSFDTFEDACAHLAKVHGLSKLGAMEKAAREHPDLVEEYNHVGIEIAKNAAEAAAPRPVPLAVSNFNKRVTEVMARDKIDRLGAMEKVTKEFPAEFDAYQSA